MMNDIEYTKMDRVEEQLFWYKALHKLVLNFIKPGDSLLDLGCGTGGVISKVKHLFKDVSGTDVSELSLDLARKKNESIHFFQADLNDIEFNRKYESIVCLDVMEYIKDDQVFVRKVCDALSENGTFILNVPAYQWMLSYHDKYTGQNKRYGKKEVFNLLRRNGFEIEFITSWNMILFPLIFIKRKFFTSERSDVENMNSFLNSIFMFLLNIELFFIKRKISLPFGLSIFVVAKKCLN